MPEKIILNPNNKPKSEDIDDIIKAIKLKKLEPQKELELINLAYLYSNKKKFLLNLDSIINNT